jgi:hypothetical protein
VYKKEVGQDWLRMSEEVVSGVLEWRTKNPRATLNQIEAAVDERLDRMRAKMLEETALMSGSVKWRGKPKEDRPLCPSCGEPLSSRGTGERSVQTRGGKQVRLKRG